MIVAKSLLHCGDFSHADLVRRLRSLPGYQINKVVLGPGGVDPGFAGQISKLLHSDDPQYQACDGVSDGAAMRMSAVAAFYGHNLQKLVETANSIAGVTHASVEARLSAILVALRLRQVFFDDQPDSILKLEHDMNFALELLDIKQEAQFFMSHFKRAKDITCQISNPDRLMTKLVENVGIEHLAWSTPISACFWSFSSDTNYSRWFRRRGEKRMYVKRPWSPIPKILHGKTMKRSVHLDDVSHLRLLGEYESYHRTHDYHWRKSLDIDTFLSIAIGIIAARHGIETIEDEVCDATHMFGDDLEKFARQLSGGASNMHQYYPLAVA